MNTDGHGFTEADERYIAERLGRTPQRVLAVAARDARGRPAVITNAPLARDAHRWMPQPTLYWLIDPVLCKRVAEAERKGAIGEIEAALEADEGLMAGHLADNAAYAEARLALLMNAEKRVAEEQGMFGVLSNTGIGGVANHRSVKCLHAQYAYHLARLTKTGTGTTVGRLMEERYGIRFEL